MPDPKDNPVSKETCAFLADVKKGKTRRFVLLCKGTKIINLVLFKKGSFEKYKMEAKEAGSGQVYYGVAAGKGENLVFQLAIDDGFQAAPVKPMTLKEFLDDMADFRCRPTFEIVKSLTAVPDEDDEEETESNESDESSSSQSQASPEAEKFAKELEAVLKRCVDLLKTQPTNATQIRAVMQYVREQAADGELAKAKAGLPRLEALLDAAQADGGKETDVIPAGKVAEMVAALSKAKLAWSTAIQGLVKAIEPVIKEHLKEDAGTARGLVKIVESYRGELAEAFKQMEQASKDPAKFAKARDAAQQTLERVSNELYDDNVLTYLDDEGVDVYGPIDDALEEIERLLAT
ncbi:MAG: hypothetical protein U0939_15055 [Pirellulales bacterium]